MVQHIFSIIIGVFGVVALTQSEKIGKDLNDYDTWIRKNNSWISGTPLSIQGCIWISRVIGIFFLLSLLRDVFTYFPK